MTLGGATLPGSTTFTSTTKITSNIDFSQVKTAYALLYKPTLFGSMEGRMLGPSLTLKDLAWASGVTNNVTGTLNASPTASVNLSIKGSAWASLFDHAAQVAPVALSTPFSLSVQPYLTDGIAQAGRNMELFAPNALPADPFTNYLGLGLVVGNSCLGYFSSSSSFPRSLPPVVVTDQDFGTVQYGDPFPATWPRVFSICQQASVQVPIPDSSEPATFVLTNGQTIAPPTAPVVPLISPVLNPTINGTSLFNASTINSTNVNLSWTKPAIGNPYGYNVLIATPTTTPLGTTAYTAVATLGTAKTSLTVPPDLLAPGHTYLFVITAVVDGLANMETSPHRSALPLANADAISAPLTISSAAAQ